MQQLKPRQLLSAKCLCLPKALNAQNPEGSVGVLPPSLRTIGWVDSINASANSVD